MRETVLRVRAAVGIERPDTETMFGVIWIEARLETDREERIAVIADLDVTDVRFPDATEEQVEILSSLLESEIPKWNLSIEMDDLIATLELADTEKETTQQISIDPPVILFYPEPAVLITIDGEPRLADSEEKAVQRVANTPYTVLYDTQAKTYYLFADEDTWYTASSIKGDWEIAGKVPSKIAKQAPDVEVDTESEEVPEGDGETGPSPRVVIATEPTELISSSGPPEYELAAGSNLYYVSNTDSDLLYEAAERAFYVLLSGRWYTSQSLDGPWLYKPGDDLPEQFRQIEEDSEIGTVLYAVPGTQVAKEAVMDARIPQTAAIDKQKASLNVEYDSEPQFEKITGTNMYWATNTETPVIRVGDTYYAVDEAVWFVSNSTRGPWEVATSVPDEIYTIPSDSPVYNVTFVRIYSEKEEVVYVGYTPGYTNTYVYHETHSVWHGLLLAWLVWKILLSSLLDLGIPCSLEPPGLVGDTDSATVMARTLSLLEWVSDFGFVGGWWGPGRYAGYRRGYRHGYRHGYRRGARAGYRARPTPPTHSECVQEQSQSGSCRNGC